MGVIGGKMYKYFKDTELKCKCGTCGSTGGEMDLEFMRKLDSIREKCGFPLVVTSAYRCPKHNELTSSTGLSGPHTTGRAIDIAVDRGKAYTFLFWSLTMGMKGVGLSQKGENRFIHVDDLDDRQPRPTIWTY